MHTLNCECLLCFRLTRLTNPESFFMSLRAPAVDLSLFPGIKPLYSLLSPAGFDYYYEYFR